MSDRSDVRSVKITKGSYVGEVVEDDPNGTHWLALVDEYVVVERGAWERIVAQLQLRPEVLAFAHLMESKLRQHDDRPGWKDCDPEWLLERLREETDELETSVNLDLQETANARSISDLPLRLSPSADEEAPDVANFAMMIVDVLGLLMCGDARCALEEIEGVEDE